VGGSFSFSHSSFGKTFSQFVLHHEGSEIGQVMSKAGLAKSEGAAPPGAGTETAASTRLAEVVREYQSPLLHYAARMLPDRPDQAQDIVQETFLRFRKRVINGTVIRKPASWLYRVAHNLAVDLNRRENRNCELEEAMLPQAAHTAAAPQTIPGPAEEFDRKESNELALAELQRLPDQEKQVLLLKLIQGLTLREISEITGANIGTIHYRLNAGIRRLARRFKEVGAM